MAEQPTPTDRSGAGSPGENGAPATGAPSWVKAFAIIGVVLVALAVWMLIGGSSEHGPNRHAAAGDAATSTGSIADHEPAPRWRRR